MRHDAVMRPSLSVNQLIDALARAELHGHGGAHFPTATKLAAVATQHGRPTVVVNGTEGEPLSHKDHFLLSRHPDSVLDGALVAARALTADRIIVAVDQRRAGAEAMVGAAIERRAELNRRRLKTTVATVPSGYVTGQETALINALQGRAPKPSFTPPYPFEKGLSGKPTLVCNAETYRQVGRVASGSYDGSRLLSVSGAVARPAVVQASPDTTVAGALRAAGGMAEPVQGVLLGGYAGTWVAGSDALELVLDECALNARGLTLGPGIVVALGESSCPVMEVTRVARWMAGQSSGQCGPCVFGLDAIAAALEDLIETGSDGGYVNIRRWCGMVSRRGACAHPDGVARFVTSALDTFGPVFDDHARHGACEACRRPSTLVTPTVAPGAQRGRETRATRERVIA